MPENPTTIPIERLGVVDSTSLEARRRLGSGRVDKPMALVAERQTGGVGRFGRRWESPAGGLWLTVIWPLGGQPGAAMDGLGLRLGLACAHAVERVVGPGAVVTIKWPNDILVGGKKVLGILTEIVGGAALVGVGVNADFDAALLPGELAARATTLRAATGRPVDVDALLDDLLPRLAGALRAKGLDPDTMSGVRARLHGVGKAATLRLGDGAVMSGTLLGLADDGRLRALVDGVETTGPAGAELFVEP